MTVTAAIPEPTFITIIGRALTTAGWAFNKEHRYAIKNFETAAGTKGAVARPIFYMDDGTQSLEFNYVSEGSNVCSSCTALVAAGTDEATAAACVEAAIRDAERAIDASYARKLHLAAQAG